MKRKNIWTIVFLLTVCSNFCMAQANEKNIIERAMIDELTRSMDSLLYDKYQKPFYIAYTIVDTKTLAISASLGALTTSSESVGRSKFVRVMVGGYDFNDESFDAENNQNSNFAVNDIQIPIEDDYAGIRRALWTSTDVVYKSASKLYEDNLYHLKEQKELKEEVNYRTFIKTPPTIRVANSKTYNYDKEKLESYMKKVSNLFKNRPDITSSMAAIAYIQGDIYFVNSEGSRIKKPINLSAMYINANAMSEDNKPMYDQLAHFSKNIDELPKFIEIEKEVKTMLSGFDENKVSNAFDDSYEGPVLFLGDAVPSLLANLVLVNNGLVSSKVINSGGYSYANNRSMEIGKKVMSKQLNVVSLPKMKTYEGVELLGAYDVDAEGVEPSDSLVLIENGILKAKMNDRTVLDSIQTANGHRRFSQRIGAGVLSIYSNDLGINEMKMKAELINQAKEEDLDYAIIVRKMGNNAYQPINVYKVSLEDGTEELLTSAMLKSISIKSLNKLVAVGDKTIAHNLPSAGFVEMSSLIVPNSILLRDVEIEKGFNNYKGQKYVVQNPVGLK